MSNRYDESSIEVERNDIKRLQKKHTMFIGYMHWKAWMHLFKEAIQNSIDELVACGNPDGAVYASYDETTKIFYMEDNGRGIPLGSLYDLCVVMNSSGKYAKGKDKAYKTAAGTHGIGQKAIVALSDFCCITSSRDGQSYSLSFEKGVKIKEEKGKTTKTGVKLLFKPNATILGDDNDYDVQNIYDLCELLNYLSKVKIKLNVINKSGKTITKLYNNKNGILDLLKDMTDTNIIDPIYINHDNGKDMSVEMALTYVPESTENIISYCSFCTTIDGGTHVTGFKMGLTEALQPIVDSVLTKKEKESLDIKGPDYRSGLVAIVNLSHDEAKFSGQIKEKLVNDDATPYVKSVIKKSMLKWVEENPKMAKLLAEFIKKSAKARNETDIIKKNTVRNVRNIFEKPKSFEPETLQKSKGEVSPYPPEFILVEGDSAGGSCKNGRDRRFQAIYKLRGVTANTIGFNAVKLRNDNVYNDIINIFDAGLGDKFKVEDLHYDKVIIATDADPDGNKITSILALFFLRHMRGLVEAGRLYKAVPPLYKVSEGKKIKYMDNQREYVNYVETLISKNLTIETLDGCMLSHSEIKDLLYSNRTYSRTLYKTANKFVVNQKLLEFIILYKDNHEKMKEALLNEFEFININENAFGDVVIDGFINRESQYIVVNDKLFNKCNDLVELIHEVNDANIIYKVNENICTMGQLLDEASKYEPKGKQRFKGLGEMNPDQLWDTTLNPENRVLIRLTAEDIEKEIATMDLLHGDTEKLREQRRELMSNFKISLDDLDS